MRLIDIDKHFELNEPFYRADIEMPLHRVKEALESLPTVQAIPTEWIEKYAKRLIELENRNYFAYRGFSDIGEAILNMLEKWEKENEAN